MRKVLAPKLTDAQRELLFRYFTEFFVDGFESGDFSEWDGTSAGSGDSVTVSSSDKHHGSYSLYAESNGNGGYEYARVSKTISPQPTLHVRAYVKPVAIGAADNQDRLYYLTLIADSAVAWAGIRNISNEIKWEVMARNGTGYVANNQEAPLTNQWYCLELYWTKHATEGEAILYVDGVQVANVSNIDTSYYGDAANLRVGLADIQNCDACAVYVDCVVVADTYVGPEATEQTRTFNVDAAFQKRDNAKSFALDAVFAYKVKLPELWLTENGKIVLNISKPYTWVGT
jgi:hypothetical protein